MDIHIYGGTQPGTTGEGYKGPRQLGVLGVQRMVLDVLRLRVGCLEAP